MASLTAEVRAQVRAARDRGARVRAGLPADPAAGRRRARLEDALTVELAGRCSWPTVPGFDIADHLATVAGIVVGAHEAAHA